MLVAGRAWREETTMTGESFGVEVPDLHGRGAPLTFPQRNRGSGPRW
jgi:hypothetical protein